MPDARWLLPGDLTPRFAAPVLDGHPEFIFDTMAGRPIVMLLHVSARNPQSAAALDVLARHRAVFDDEKAAFFGVSVDPADVSERRIAAQEPGIRWFLDPTGAISRRFGALVDGPDGKHAMPHWLLLDSALRVVMHAPIGEGEAVMAALAGLTAAEGRADSIAPVLVVPGIFEPELCRTLIATFESQGGEDSGFMREVDGLTTRVMDHGFKRRDDCTITDEALKDRIGERIRRRLLPQIMRAFQFDATRIERWMVACYSGERQGFFRPHRDNTTKGTAHRKFACTINLNAEDYDGGDLRFPEFGQRTYRAPTGGAVIFSCSLQHEALPVTRGRRYAFLPFFYDDEGATLRQRNLAYLTPEPARGSAPPAEMSPAK